MGMFYICDLTSIIIIYREGFSLIYQGLNKIIIFLCN